MKTTHCSVPGGCRTSALAACRLQRDEVGDAVVVAGDGEAQLIRQVVRVLQLEGGDGLRLQLLRGPLGEEPVLVEQLVHGGGAEGAANDELGEALRRTGAR